MHHRCRSVRARLLLVVVFALTVTAGLTACRRRATPPPATAAKTAFDVERMTCASCALTVRAALRAVEGVYDGRVDVEQGKAWVRYDPKRTDPQAIARAISAAGYPARPAR